MDAVTVVVEVRVVDAVTVVVKARVVDIVTGVDARVKARIVDVVVTGVVGGGANPSSRTAFGLISFANITASVFCVSSNLSASLVTSSRISLHTVS